MLGSGACAARIIASLISPASLAAFKLVITTTRLCNNFSLAMCCFRPAITCFVTPLPMSTLHLYSLTESISSTDVTCATCTQARRCVYAAQQADAHEACQCELKHMHSGRCITAKPTTVNILAMPLSSWLLVRATQASHTVCKLMAANRLHTCNCALAKSSWIAGCEPAAAPAAGPVSFGCVLAAPAAFFPAFFASATHTAVRCASRVTHEGGAERDVPFDGTDFGS